jgi:hypothetical protein
MFLSKASSAAIIAMMNMSMGPSNVRNADRRRAYRARTKAKGAQVCSHLVLYHARNTVDVTYRMSTLALIMI